MAHELDFSKGRAAVFSVRESMWHREGVILPRPPTVEEGLVYAGLDFEVVKRPVFIGQPTDAGFAPAQLSRLAYVTVRMDTGAELGSVGPEYTVLQNRDAFKVLQPLLDRGITTLETGGALRGGRDVWVLARFNIEHFGPVVREVFADEVIPFAALRNNHAGTMGARVQLTPIRWVCANTLGAGDARAESGLDRAITVRHTGDIEARLVEAAQQLLGGIIERYEVVAQQYRLLKSFYLDEAMFRELVIDVAAPDPRDNPQYNPDAPTAEMVLGRSMAKQGAIRAAWSLGRGHLGDGSAWEAYNGLVEVVDHNRDLFPTRAGAWRTASLLDGKLGQIKRDVLAGLVEAARAA